MRRLLLVGGLGNNHEYFQNFIRELQRCDDALHVYFYELFTTPTIDHVEILKEFIDIYQPHVVVAFSMSSFLSIDAINRTSVNRIKKIKIVLIDPPNLIHDVSFCTENIPSASCSSFINLKPESRRCNSLIGSLYLGWMDMLLEGTKHITMVRSMICKYFDTYYSSLKDRSPTIVNDVILKISASDLKTSFRKYIFEYKPFHDVKSANIGIIHIITASASTYRNYCNLLSDFQVMTKLHEICDSNHHMLYYDPLAAANKLLAIM